MISVSFRIRLQPVICFFKGFRFQRFVAYKNWAPRRSLVFEARFLGAVSKLRKATITFVMSVRLSTWKNSAPTGRACMKFVCFSKICRENSCFIKIGHCTWRPIHIFLLSYLVQFFSEWENFRKKFVEKIKIHILCTLISPPPHPHPENYALYGIMLKSIVQPDRPQMTVRCIRIACWTTTATYLCTRPSNEPLSLQRISGGGGRLETTKKIYLIGVTENSLPYWSQTT